MTQKCIEWRWCSQCDLNTFENTWQCKINMVTIALAINQNRVYNCWPENVQKKRKNQTSRQPALCAEYNLMNVSLFSCNTSCHWL